MVIPLDPPGTPPPQKSGPRPRWHAIAAGVLAATLIGAVGASRRPAPEPAVPAAQLAAPQHNPDPFVIGPVVDGG